MVGNLLLSLSNALENFKYVRNFMISTYKIFFFIYSTNQSIVSMQAIGPNVSISRTDRNGGTKDVTNKQVHQIIDKKKKKVPLVSSYNIDSK